MHKDLLKPAHLKKLCEEYNLRPSKKYGQNFLISDIPIKKMIEAADLKKTDTVVEIGPGFGILTLAVAPLVDRVVAFEIERKLENYWDEIRNIEIARLPARQGNNVEIVWGNVINKWKEECGKWKAGHYKVLANLPYSITSNVLRVILESENKPESVTVMVQKEVAERICAKPRSAGSRQAGDMSLLAVSIQYYGEPKIVCQVTKGNFWPEPRVDSAIITLTPKHLITLTRVDGEKFFRVVKAGFANKRKQLWRNLSAGLNLDQEKVKQVLHSVCGNELVRAQELSVSEWIDVVRKLGE